MLNQLFSNTEGRGRMTSVGSYRIRLGLFDTGSFWSFNIPGSGSILAATLHDLLKKKENKSCQDTCRSHIQFHIWMQWKKLFRIQAVPIHIADWYFSGYFLWLPYWNMYTKKRFMALITFEKNVSNLFFFFRSFLNVFDISDSHPNRNKR